MRSLYPRRRPFLLALGFALATQSAAWAAPTAALDRFETFRMPARSLAQVTPPPTTTQPAPGPTAVPGPAAIPPPTSPPLLPPAADPAPAPAPAPTVLLLNAPPAQESVTDKWWFWAAIGGVIVVTATVLLVATRGQDEPSTKLGNMEAFK